MPSTTTRAGPLPPPKKSLASSQTYTLISSDSDCDSEHSSSTLAPSPSSSHSASSLEKGALPKPSSSARRHRHRRTLPYSSSRHQRNSAKRRESCLTWLRWTIVVCLQVIIIVSLALRSGSSRDTAKKGEAFDVEAGGDINGIFPRPSSKYIRLQSQEEIYMPNMSSSLKADRMETRRRWDELMPRGSGSLSIPNYAQYPLLGEPITDDPLRSGPLFEASWTHALHCLYYSVDSYHQLLLAYNAHERQDSSSSEHTLRRHELSGAKQKSEASKNSEANKSSSEEKDEGLGDKWDAPNPTHASHCFEYLRNSIMCNMDMTLEGDYSAHREGGGQGHVCRDPEEVVRWIEERRVDDRRDIVGP